MDSIGWVQDYVRLLAAPEPESWDQAWGLKRVHFPTHLYRYRPATAASFMCVLHETIWLAAPRTFNDPFDSALSLDALSHIKASMRSRPRSWIQNASALPSDVIAELEACEDPHSVLSRVFEHEVAKQAGPEAGHKAHGFLEQFIAQHSGRMSRQLTELNQRGLKVGCFSETGTSLPMWAYYTNNHKGFCVEYPVAELPAESAQFRMLHPVLYVSQRTEAEVLLGRILMSRRPNPFFATLAAIHTAADWSHEREWRMVNPSGDDSPGMEAAMPRPSRILLGRDMDAAYKEGLVKLAAGFGIPVVGTTLAHDKFALEPEPSNGVEGAGRQD